MSTFTINSNGIASANFANLEAEAKKKTDAELHYAIRDCREAERAFPEGHKAGYYLDVCHTYGSELLRRRG